MHIFSTLYICQKGGRAFIIWQNRVCVYISLRTSWNSKPRVVRHLTLHCVPASHTTATCKGIEKDIYIDFIYTRKLRHDIRESNL